MLRPRGSSKSCWFSLRITRYCWSNFCNWSLIFTLLSFSVFSTSSAKKSRRCWKALRMPKPNSALSSNSELPQATPRPVALSFVYGTQPAVPPQMLLQPVAFATISRLPNICVMSFAYGVSPHPSQAPENSISGCWNWEPFKVNGSKRAPRFGTFMAKFQNFSCPDSMALGKGVIVNALVGQAWVQTSHPVQSRGDAWMRKCKPAYVLPPVALRASKPSGLVSSSPADRRKGRMTA
mmetsp:Transcript_30686/g.88579  ORF Transcript_30686/g.88579 Transcript_30686/m.88579 type:complete len:236 (-) Transcript_30686:1093-1800(-)